MKTTIKNKLLSTLTAVLLGFGLAGQASATVYTLSGNMDVFQALSNPGNVGNGTGTISGSYDDVTDLLNYSISWQNLTGTVTNMHFHLGAPGVPGGVELPIPGPWSSPQIGTNIALNAAQEQNLLAGLWYVNVHTTTFGGGEIRGQVNAAVPEPGTVALLALGMFGLAYRRKPLG